MTSESIFVFVEMNGKPVIAGRLSIVQTDKGRLGSFVYGKSWLARPEVLADTVILLHKIVSLSDKVLPMKAYLDIVQDIQRNAVPPRPPCSEDIFMIAAAFLQVEIAKQGAFYYLKGESPEVKETKKLRKLLDLKIYPVD